MKQGLTRSELAGRLTLEVGVIGSATDFAHWLVEEYVRFLLRALDLKQGGHPFPPHGESAFLATLEVAQEWTPVQEKMQYGDDHEHDAEGDVQAFPLGLGQAQQGPSSPVGDSPRRLDKQYYSRKNNT